MLEEFGERIRRDEELPGKPVVSVDLSSTKVTDADLKDLTPLTQLQWLDLGETQVTDEGLEHLAALNQLRELNLNDTRVTDEGLEHLAALTQLWELDLSHTQVTDEGLKHLDALTQLQWLNLNDTRVTDEGLKHLAALTGLQKLYLELTQVTDLKHLAPLTQLQWLNLTCTRVTDEGLKHLAPLTQLQWLDLGETRVTDEGLKHLAPLTRLQSLNLRDTRVTDEGLKHLAPLTQLQWVGLMWTKVTDAAVNDLKAALPMWSSPLRKGRVLPDGHGVPEAKPMQTILRRLLDRLDAIAEQHDELGELFTSVAMTAAVFDGFLRPVPDFALPVQFVMWSDEGDRLVHQALAEFLPAANECAATSGLTSFRERLSAFQDDNVQSATGKYYDHYFGRCDPELFDASGNEISQPDA
jgi:Leucine Rich repeat